MAMTVQLNYNAPHNAIQLPLIFLPHPLTWQTWKGSCRLTVLRSLRFLRRSTTLGTVCQDQEFQAIILCKMYPTSLDLVTNGRLASLGIEARQLPEICSLALYSK
jgi:hypothetical protein